MRLASLALGIALVSCGDKARPAVEIVSPPQLSRVDVWERSDKALLVIDMDEKVRVLAPDTYLKLAELEGVPVWAGRGSWGQSVVEVEEPDAMGRVLVRVDGSDKLVVTPPAETGWKFAFRECGPTLCSITWRDEANKQFVDVVDMTKLIKLTSYAREVAATPGAVDPKRDVIYHDDKGFRVVAEDQRTGKLLWTTPLDAPTQGEFKSDQLAMRATANGRYVLAIYGWYAYRSEFQDPTLELLDSATGEVVATDEKQFAALTSASVLIDSVPGTDDVLITQLVTRAGESRDVGLSRLIEVDLPSLKPVRRHDVPSDDRMRLHAPSQLIPLAPGRVLAAGR